MSNDRHHDEQVSAAYQDLAAERTPEHLDQKVLRMAKAAGGRPLYSRWVAWSRPLAWAATVALCLAITLEVTRVEDAPTDVATPASTVVPELQKDKREQALEQDADRQLGLAESMSDSMSDSVADALSSEKIAPARSASKPAANEPEPAGRARRSADIAEEEAIELGTIEPAVDFEVKVADELRRENSVASGAYATSKAVAADSLANECSEDMRSEPESWLECIEALEASGDKEAALHQRQNLEETFPDFKLP